MSESKLGKTPWAAVEASAASRKLCGWSTGGGFKKGIVHSPQTRQRMAETARLRVKSSSRGSNGKFISRGEI